MAEGSGQAPAGWYDDPHSPGRLRYFDGELWTNHFHDPGRLPDIGSWLNSAFSVFGQYWIGAAAIALVTTFVGNAVVWLALTSVTKDWAVIDEELVNFEALDVVLVAGVVGFGLLWQGFGWLSMNRFMQRSHFQANPTVGDAFRHALQRLPKYVGVTFGLLLAAVLGSIVVVFLSFLSPFSALVVILGVVVGAVWLMVKLAFLPAAITAAPASAPALRTSASVSTGRFWPVFGRILLVFVVLGLGTNIVSALLGDFGSPIDQEATSSIFEVRNDELRVFDFAVRDLFPSTGRLLIVIVTTTVIQAASGMLSTSAFMRLYLDSGAPSELSAAND